jgi:hypothetical protein
MISPADLAGNGPGNRGASKGNGGKGNGKETAPPVSNSGGANSVADETAALGRIRDNPNGPVLNDKAPNTNLDRPTNSEKPSTPSAAKPDGDLGGAHSSENLGGKDAGGKQVPGNGGGELSGSRTVIPPSSDAATTRSLNRENESASFLADNGFKVEQNPKVPGSKNPDYKINGEIFDNYAPSTSNVRNAASEIKGKVDRGQADNVVINLTDTSITPSALRKQLSDYPIPGLKVVIVIDKTGAPIVMNFGKK